MKNKGEKQQVVYYNDELNDEFSNSNIQAKVIDENYVYIKHGKFSNLNHRLWYNLIAKPVARIYTKTKFGNKIINKKVLKPFKKQGIFIYGNHTQQVFDVLLPIKLCAPKKMYAIVHPDNVSMKFLGKITPFFGALPLPGNVKATRNFLSAIKQRISERASIVIYPEAHIWPYYTKIRPFKSASFKYPIQLNAPTFCFTNTYQKRKRGKKPKIITYVDGPFYPNKDLPLNEMQEDLRNRVYNAMVERSKLSNIEVIKYIKENK